MSKAAFLTLESAYILSIATTAGVNSNSVKVLSVDEFATRSFRIIFARRLLATSVHVQTSVVIASGQQNLIQDQSALNANLIKNGLPSCTLEVQFPSTAMVGITTPAPNGLGSASSSSSSSSNIPIGAIVGGAVGLVLMVFGGCVFYRKKLQTKNSSNKAAISAAIVVSNVHPFFPWIYPRSNSRFLSCRSVLLRLQADCDMWMHCLRGPMGHRRSGGG